MRSFLDLRNLFSKEQFYLYEKKEQIYIDKEKELVSNAQLLKQQYASIPVLYDLLKPAGSGDGLSIIS